MATKEDDLVQIKFLSETGESIGIVEFTRDEWSFFEIIGRRRGLTAEEYVLDAIRKQLGVDVAKEEAPQETELAGPPDES